MKFKFVVEANEYGINPRLDNCKIFFNDLDLDKFLLTFDEDSDYVVYKFDGNKFTIINEHLNF